MKISVTIIPRGLVGNYFLSSFYPFLQTKNMIRFSASWWSGDEKYFCLLFVASGALLQSNAELRIFLHIIPVRITVSWFNQYLNALKT